MNYFNFWVTDKGVSLKLDSKVLNFIIKIFTMKAKRKITKWGYIPKDKKVQTVCDVKISFNCGVQNERL